MHGKVESVQKSRSIARGRPHHDDAEMSRSLYGRPATVPRSNAIDGSKLSARAQAVLNPVARARTTSPSALHAAGAPGIDPPAGPQRRL